MSGSPITVDRKFAIGDTPVDGYFTVQNIANVQIPVDPSIDLVPVRSASAPFSSIIWLNL